MDRWPNNQLHPILANGQPMSSSLTHIKSQSVDTGHLWSSLNGPSTTGSSVDNAGVIREQLWSVMVTPGQFMALITTPTAASAVTEGLLYNILNKVFFFLYYKI